MVRVRAVPLLLVVAIAAACGSRPDANFDGRNAASVGAEATPPAPARGAAIAYNMAPGPDTRSDDLLPQGADTASATAPMLIRNGSATLEVDSLERAMAQLQQLAHASGGYVTGTAMQTGPHEVRRATLDLRVPSARFDQARSGLDSVGEVESVQVTAQDVGEEYVDVGARLANARRLETRLVDLLAHRTGKLDDVLSVERELARVREEIERYEGRMRYLRSQVAMSTLSVTVHEPYPVVAGGPGGSVLGEAFRDAWRNFVHFIAGFIALLGILVPLGALAALVLLVAIAVRRRLPRTPPPAPVHAPAAGERTT
ncbi:MAG TPA: DUF4349 domain-containing protein [Gemmatimonadaceae bacterium]|nr:DUF4349 domain-containing protein [Gemmatimonadaceae bacterium]